MQRVREFLKPALFCNSINRSHADTGRFKKLLHFVILFAFIQARVTLSQRIITQKGMIF